MRRLKVAGQISAGTSFIELDDVHVPVENLIGQEGMGMKYIMTNFNHERMNICVGVTRQARVALSAAFEYVTKREAFGKTLIEQPVVRMRLADAGVKLETLSAWTDQMLYQLANLTKADADRELGGLTAMAKAEAGRVLRACVDCAVLLFGGNGYTRTGQGELIESKSISSVRPRAYMLTNRFPELYREVPGARIPGGSEDVLLDLGIRQLLKNYQSAAAKLVPQTKL